MSYTPLTKHYENIQAIIPLPNYFSYNLPFSQGRNDLEPTVNASLIASYYSGLPIFSTFLSRPSVTESIQIFKQYLSCPYRQDIAKISDNKKDFLVLVPSILKERLLENEKDIVNKSTRISNNSKYSIYRLPVNMLIHSDENARGMEFEKLAPSLKPYKGFLVADTTKYFYSDSFDSLHTDINLNGKGAFVGLKRGHNIICNINTEKMDTTKEYNISFWYYNHIWDQTFNTAIITEKDTSGKMLQEIYYSPLDGRVVDGWWYLSEKIIKVKSNHSRLVLIFSGEKKFENWFSVDELLIRQMGMDVWKINKTNRWICLNNAKWCEKKNRLSK